MADELATDKGDRFSQIYLKRGLPLSDSRRMRIRLSEQLRHLNGNETKHLGRLLMSELGVELKDQFGYYQLEGLFATGEIRDVLDAVTVFYEYLKSKRESEYQVNRTMRYPGRFQTVDPNDWLSFVQRTFQQENVGYRVDGACVVHYFVDEESERNRMATLAALDNKALLNARATFEDAYRHLDSQPRDTKAAVRSIFECAEVLAKQICPEAQQLNKRLAEGVLRERCINSFARDSTERRVLEGLFESLGGWVNSLHNYRHGQAAVEPVAPSEELAVYVASTGAAHIRMLATCWLRISGSVPV